ncbi:MAG: hypothetical protein SCARUB_04994, partial [Candidatus Scalindua rubra]
PFLAWVFVILEAILYPQKLKETTDFADYSDFTIKIISEISEIWYAMRRTYISW